MSDQSPTRIALLTAYDWGHEFVGIAEGTVPTHRVMGAIELQQLGYQVAFHTEGPSTGLLRRFGGWRVAQLRWLLGIASHVDVVLATHESAGMPALLLRRLGLFRRPIVVVTVAAIAAAERQGLKGWLMRRALKGADAATVFASSQSAPVRRLTGAFGDFTRVIPLGVDIDFFAHVDGNREDFVLAAGTNPGKDFETLVTALPEGMPCVIVTDPANRAKAEPLVQSRQVTFKANLPITELRDLYSRARVVVIPLLEATLSSGQTVLLENQAMGTPLIVTDVSGIRDYLVEGIRTVPPRNVPAMKAALEARSPDGVARCDFTVQRMAAAIGQVIEDVLVRGSAHSD